MDILSNTGDANPGRSLLVLDTTALNGQNCFQKCQYKIFSDTPYMLQKFEENSYQNHGDTLFVSSQKKFSISFRKTTISQNGCSSSPSISIN